MQAGDMTGKVALVTGSGDYLGRATALSLATAGADLCLVDRERAGLETTADMVRALGSRAHVIPADIATQEGCLGAVAVSAKAFGRLDALCNIANAFRPSRAMSMPRQDWELTFAINLTAPFYLIQAALPHLLETGGAVVNGTSPAGELARPFSAAYAASKAGLTQLTRSLAAEFMDREIRINMVSYSGIVMSTASAASLPADLDPKLFHKAEVASRPPRELKEVADLVAFLASDAAAGFHGSCVTIDNGVSLGL